MYTRSGIIYVYVIYIIYYIYIYNPLKGIYKALNPSFPTRNQPVGPRGIQEVLDRAEVVAEGRLLALDAHVVGVVASKGKNVGMPPLY